MDFLTQPLHPVRSTDSDTSSLTSSSSHPTDRDDPFNPLRTLPPSRSTGLPTEKRVLFPSLAVNAEGRHWRSFSKVVVSLVVWNDGRRRNMKEKVEKELRLEGTLVISSTNEIFFLINPSIPPYHAPLTSPKIIKSNSKIGTTLSHVKRRMSVDLSPSSAAGGKRFSTSMKLQRSMSSLASPTLSQDEGMGLTMNITKVPSTSPTRSDESRWTIKETKINDFDFGGALSRTTTNLPRTPSRGRYSLSKHKRSSTAPTPEAPSFHLGTRRPSFGIATHSPNPVTQSIHRLGSLRGHGKGKNKENIPMVKSDTFSLSRPPTATSPRSILQSPSSPPPGRSSVRLSMTGDASTRPDRSPQSPYIKRTYSVVEEEKEEKKRKRSSLTAAFALPVDRPRPKSRPSSQTSIRTITSAQSKLKKEEGTKKEKLSPLKKFRKVVLGIVAFRRHTARPKDVDRASELENKVEHRETLMTLCGMSDSRPLLTPEEREKDPMAVACDEQQLCPLPIFKGYKLTALHIASPSSILKHRFYTSSSSPSLSDSEGEPKNPYFAGEVGPRVELDIRAHPEDRAGDVEGRDARKREVTVGFSFLDPLLAAEAEEFHVRIGRLVALASLTGGV